MITVQHGQMVNHSMRVGLTPICIAKASVQTLKSGFSSEMLISPSVSRPTVTKID
jgi:hypothetical protein